MEHELPKAYNWKEHEDEIYRRWEASGYFSPEVCVEKGVTKNDAPVFSIMMPPPNVTGVLHLGHAMEDTLMDIVTRFHRLRGERTLCLPGTDHSAVATQARVERDLIESGKYKNPRQELGREKLLGIIRAFAEESKTVILAQIRKMGLSCDWDRLAYTFDEKRSKAVNEVFQRMFKDGLIYRGHRVVNWSVLGQSTCSDDELEYTTETTTLYTFRYSKDFPFPIASTRPETKLGDTAVAVHPDDSRYQQYVGKEYTVDVGATDPIKIKIITDPTVDPAFGTGAVGVTPAHSVVDFEMYEKQKAKGEPIELVSVIGQDGKMSRQAGSTYAGFTVNEARAKFVLYLRSQNLIEKEETITHNVAMSDRFHDVVEIIPMTQWFVNVNKEIPGRGKSLKDFLREAVTTGHNNDATQKVDIVPERFHKSYLSWIDHLRDWCISRQIWWGHRIPVWYCLACKREAYIFALEKPEKCARCGGQDFVQDEDTLDTWFSSGLWTFSTLGWPDETKDLLTFHPTTFMQMGYEILFFWMARMILMSTYLLDEIPFRTAYIHGILRNEEGKKFSKSNKVVADPFEFIEKFGCDALRLSLILGVTPGNDSRFYLEKIEGTRNFVNKLWNISRFILSHDGIANGNLSVLQEKDQTLADRWILSRFHELTREVTSHLERYEFSPAIEKIRDFTWGDFADWYLEIAKIEGDKIEILAFILKNLLILAHPFIPFVTEVIYQGLPENLKTKEFLMIERWPEMHEYKHDKTVFGDFDLLQEIITTIRNIRSEHKVPENQKIPVTVFTHERHDLISSSQEMIKKLAKIEPLEIRSGSGAVENSVEKIVHGIEFFIPQSSLAQSIDPMKLRKEANELKSYIENQKKKLANAEFIARAPAQVVETEQQKLKSAEEKLEKLEGQK